MFQVPSNQPLLRYTIPSGCRERFLSDGGGPGSQALQASFLRAAGLSDLVAPYDILRTPFSHDHAVLITLEGTGQVQSGGGETWPLAPGTVCLLPATREQRYWTLASWSMLWFHPMRCPLWDGLLASPRVQTIQGAGTLSTLAELFLAERLRGRPDSRRVLEALGRCMAAFLEREAGAPLGETAHASRLEALWKAVAARPEADWSLAACAHACGMSPRALQAAVALQRGHGVAEAVTRIRMDQACSFLAHTDWKVEEIAARSGYGNAFAFSRAFSRVMGTSPSGYRASVRVPGLV